MAKKPDCYKCIYRSNISGDAHISCKFPDSKKINIKADPHGIKSGWFMWPFNFDPVWLEKCSGFKEENVG